MEEEKAAAYYDELTRKGEGAARFKQGLGFSSAAVPERGSAIASSSSFHNQFVKASNPKSTENDSEIRSIRDKLKKKKPEDQQHPKVPERSHRESSERRRYRSRERDDIERDRSHRRRSRSRSAERSRSRYGDRERRRRRSRSRSSSPRRERRRSEDERRGRRREDVKEKKIDYSRLIKGYDDMSAAEKVKAKMKFQLDETAEKDTSKGAGWERFEFDKDAPVDDEEVEEGTDDDAAIVKRMGQSFRFSAIEEKREEQLKAAHDEAMFGAPIGQTRISNTGDDVTETTNNVKDDEGESNSAATNLLSEKVLAKQQGSWRDRARKS
uniref:Serine/threonine-protein kinase fray2 n=1 Tax=Noccaea caerulescens TaxID=107243 RepID=A0A1J3IU45_NOCCA